MNTFALRQRRGFALPLAILVMAVLTAAVAAGFASTTGEVVTNNAQRAQDRAYQIAEAGLQQFMVRRSEPNFCTSCASGDPAWDNYSESMRVPMTGGYADVVAYQVRKQILGADTTPPLYFIRSKGVDTMIKMSGAGSTIYAERTVGQYASWSAATIKVLAAWTSLSGVNRTGSGTASELDGNDACGVRPPVAGVTVPKGGQYRGNFVLTGSPGVDSSMTLDSLKKRVGIDWAAIKNNNAIPAEYTLPSTGTPWPTGVTGWPVFHITAASYVLNTSGYGIIIADNDFTLSGSLTWRGIILVGGKLSATGNSQMSALGATMSGLNLILSPTSPGIGETTDDGAIANRKDYRYHSCNIANATKRLKNYISMPNTWLDNVAAW